MYRGPEYMGLWKRKGYPVTSSMLNVDLTPEDLSEIYETNYYWYLNSQPFRDVLLQPLGQIINRRGLPCLDVGCGEGWLAAHVTVPYVGFDGSAIAIRRAKARHPDKLFHCGRLENPTCSIPRHSTIVFGNLLAVLVREECYVDFLEMYRERFAPAVLIVYDLERTDLSAIRQRYRLLEEYHASVKLPDIEKVKRHRQIVVFACN